MEELKLNKAPIDGSDMDTFTGDTKPPRDVSMDSPTVYKKNPNVSFSVLANDYLINSDPDYFQRLVDSGKNNFQDLLIGIQGLMNDVVSIQNLQDLDDTTRIEFTASQTKWRDIITCVRSYATSINRRIAGLSNAIIVDKNGQLHYDENAVCGDSSSFYFNEKNAPHLLSLHLSELLTDICYFSIQLVKAVNFQHYVDSLFKQKSQKIEEFVNNRLNAMMESLSVLEKQIDTIQKVQAENQRQSTVQNDRSISKLEKIEDKVDKRNRAEKRKQLKLTTCLAAIQEVYEDPKYNYPQQFEFHYFSIKKTLSGWNQYMKTDGEKGDPPLPQFDFYRHTDKETFKKWVRDIFFPDYRERSHKDALKSAFHPDNIDDVCVLSQQDILEDIDESLNNDRE